MRTHLSSIWWWKRLNSNWTKCETKIQLSPNWDMFWFKIRPYGSLLLLFQRSSFERAGLRSIAHYIRCIPFVWKPAGCRRFLRRTQHCRCQFVSHWNAALRLIALTQIWKRGCRLSDVLAKATPAPWQRQLGSNTGHRNRERSNSEVIYLYRCCWGYWKPSRFADGQKTK